MKIYRVTQGTEEWLRLRAGIPTASAFDRIITPGGKPSKSAETYMYELLAERIMGHPVIEAVSRWMDRGSQMEAEAVAFYEMQRELDSEKVGFITNDAGTIGASPDRLVGPDGLLEIKVPKESTHVGYLLRKAVDQEYRPQVQGQLWVSSLDLEPGQKRREWADILSYHPEMPPALIRVPRDEEYIALLAGAVEGFSRELEARAEELTARGWIKERDNVMPPVSEAFTEAVERARVCAKAMALAEEWAAAGPATGQGTRPTP